MNYSNSLLTIQANHFSKENHTLLMDSHNIAQSGKLGWLLGI